MSPTGNRVVSFIAFVRGFARLGCLMEFALQDPASLMPFPFVVAELSLFLVRQGAFPFNLVRST